MTEPTINPESEAIVDALLQRLRALQATGESEVVNRRITAGAGLTGGGTLTDDLQISLSQPVLDSLARADRSVSDTALQEALAGYASEQAVADLMADYVRRSDGYRIAVLPFTHPGYLTGTVDAPPLIMAASGVIESVAIGLSEPGADLTVTVAGRASQLRAGQTSLVVEHGGPVTAGGALRLSLQSTGARGITVAVRVREAV